jgi:tetratricopeptide (TPR) repeat protein
LRLLLKHCSLITLGGKCGNTLQPLQRLELPAVWTGLNKFLGQFQSENSDIERSIEASTDTIALHAETHSLEWVRAINARSLLYFQRTCGNREENVRLGIEGLEAAANRLSELGEFDECIASLMVLAKILQECGQLERTVGILEFVMKSRAATPGISEFDEAVERLNGLINPDDPAACATICRILGQGFVLRTSSETGDRNATAERAVQHLSVALHTYAQLGDRLAWAETSIVLGRAYFQKLSSNRAEDLNIAIDAIRSGIEQLPAEYDPERMAMSRRQLALAYMEHPSLNNRAELAREQLQAALDALDALDGLGRGSTRALVTASMALVAMRAGEDLSQARELLANALEMFPSSEDPWVWAEMQEQLLTTLLMRAVEHREPLDAVLTFVRPVLDVYTLERAPRRRRIVLANLGFLHASRGEWVAAADAYGSAVEASDWALAATRSEAGRLVEVSEAGPAYAGYAHALAILGDVGAAAVAAERAGIRLVGSILAVEAFGDTTESDLEFLDKLRTSMRYLESQERRTDDDRMDPADVDQRLRELHRIQAEEIMEAELRALITPDFLAQLVPRGGAAVVPVFSAVGCAVIVIPSGIDVLDERHLVRVDSLDADEIHRMLVGNRADSWMVQRFVLNGDDGSPDYLEWRQAFDEQTRQILQELSTLLIIPVVDRLAELGVSEGAHVVWVAHGGLTQFPLHAAPIGAGDVLLDRYAISYSPNLTTLTLCRRRSGRAGGRILAILNPTGDLRGAAVEGGVLRNLSENVEELRGEDATVDAVVARAPGARYLHFACHGKSDLGRPFESGLVLAGGELLTIDWLREQVNLRAARLVVLSACDSGVSEYLFASSEGLGLPNALIEAGAAGVVGSLWSVGDESTAALMRRFYQLHLGEGVAPPFALRIAQIEARQQSDRPGPYEWGAFFVVGV